MTQTITEASAIPADADTISQTLARYLCVINPDTNIKNDLSGALEADDVLYQVLDHELTEIAKSLDDLGSTTMSITDFLVRATVATMNCPPREAIAEIALLQSRLRSHLAEYISDAKEERA